MKDIYVTLATFLTQLKKLYKNIRIIRVSLSSKKWYLLLIKNNKFSFEPITSDDISQQIKRLDINKATHKSYIPTKLLKRYDNLIVDYVQENFNNCLWKGTFPKDFKKTVVHPTHKKDCQTEKSNHRPISILTNLSKIDERVLYDQTYTYISNVFPQYQCGFCKVYSAQHCPLAKTEK